MRFGLLYSFEAPTEFGASTAQVYREGLGQIAEADRRGIDSIWLTEHHFFEDSYCPSPMMVAAAVAAVTEQVRICQGIVVLPLYGHPMKLAEDCAVVDNISGGRFELGVGQGYRADEFDGFGYEFASRRAMYLEGLEILNLAFSGERFSFEGKHYNVLDAQLKPGLVQQPPPPLWVGAATPKTRRRVADDGHRLLISLLTDLEHTKAQFDDYRVSLQAAGRPLDDEPIALIRDFYVAETTEQAWAEVRPHLMHTYRNVYAPPGVAMIERMADGSRRLVTDLDDPFYESEAFWKDRFIIGDRYRDELGVTDLILRMQHPGQADEQVRRCLSLLTDEVIPAVEAT
jgi:alkanesulfonate monooxygenase SsuD/methylene tetrahydromethanopterin reductase-like flavin-dependent oxidoreductase (luciferase family)